MSSNATYTRRGALGLMAAWGLFLAGCAGRASGPETSFQSVEPPETMEPGTLRLATSFTYPPMYMKQNDGEITGFGYSISVGVTQLMRLRLDRIPCASAQEVFDRVSAREADLGTTCYERGALPDDLVSSNALIACNVALIDHDGASGLVGADGLAGVEGKIVAQDRAVVRAWLEGVLEPDRYELLADAEEALQAVREDRAVVAVVEQPVALYYLESLYTTLKVVDTVDTGWGYGFICHRDDQDLMDAVNQAEAQMKDEGVFESLETRWFGGSI